MDTPEWLKPGIYGAVVGAVAISIIGFGFGGWVTGGSANKMATILSHDDVIAALVPVCADMALTDVNRSQKLDVIRAASSYKQRDAVMEAGWATVPGSEEPNRDLAQACLTVLPL